MIIGCLGRSLISLLVLAAVLAAGYLLLLKPIVDDASNTINRAFDGNEGLVEGIRGALDSAGVDGLDIDLDSVREARGLLACIQRAGQDRDAVKRCGRRYE